MPDITRCRQCDTVIAGEDPACRQPCENCESINRNLEMDLENQLQLHEMLESKQKRPVHKKPIVEDRSGEELTIKTGRFSKKERVIDRLNNRYYEFVQDPETGEVLWECDEKLTDHYGHGSARRSTEASHGRPR